MVDGIIHRLKILDIFADDILEGNKTFELRYNDRNYQKGDFIKFVVVDGEGHVSRHPLGRELFQIVYFFDGHNKKQKRFFYIKTEKYYYQIISIIWVECG